MTERDTSVCEPCESAIEASLDGDLEPARFAAFEAHLTKCAACAEELARASRLRDHLRALPRLDAPRPVVAAVLESARSEAETRGRRRAGWLGPLRARPALAVVAAVVLLAIALVTSLDRTREPSGVVASSDPEVMRATLETKLALAHFARANRRVGRGLSEDLLRERVVRPAVRKLIEAPAAPGLAIEERG